MNDDTILISGKVFQLILNYIGSKPYTEVNTLVAAIQGDLAARASQATQNNQPTVPKE
jgi:NADPH-dependent 7-cyano-7-deazaguanine reductase QueF-like protein